MDGFVAVALADKMARIGWALMTRQEDFRAKPLAVYRTDGPQKRSQSLRGWKRGFTLLQPTALPKKQFYLCMTGAIHTWRLCVEESALHSPSNTDTQIGERSEEAAVLGLVGVDAAVHRAKELVGAIAEADFGVAVFHRQADERAEIRHRDHA
jgi:hypothetical protein